MCTFPKYIAWNNQGHKIIKRDPFCLPDDGEGWLYAIVPCRHCPECRQAKQLNMINKALYFEETHKTSYLYFITLTVNDFYIDEFNNYNTKLDYIQKFIKRLRRCRNSKGDKYILVEEFGKLHDRRHFHMIYFTDYNVTVSQVRRCWDYGFIKLDNLSYNYDRRTPILYTLKYINKTPASFNSEHKFNAD